MPRSRSNPRRPTSPPTSARREPDSEDGDPLAPMRHAIAALEEADGPLSAEKRWKLIVGFARNYAPRPGLVPRMRRAARLLDDAVELLAGTFCEAGAVEVRDMVRRDLLMTTGRWRTAPERTRRQQGTHWYELLLRGCIEREPDLSFNAAYDKVAALLLQPDASVDELKLTAGRVRAAMKRKRLRDSQPRQRR